MRLQFNPAQLSRPQRQSLIEVLGVIESENDQEIDVRVVEWPLKFVVKLDDDIEMLLGWDVDKQSYAGLTTPEPTEPEPEPKPEPEPESLTETKPEPELDLSPFFERADALARALINLTKPLNVSQRKEVWIKFCIVSLREFI